MSLRETPLFAALPLCNGFSTLFAHFRATYYRTGENSPSSRKPQVSGKLGALSEKHGFRTRNRLLKEGTFLFCHPEQSRPQGGAVASFCVTLSEPPNGGESNGSAPFHMLAICSLCCFGGLHTAFDAFGSDPSAGSG